MGFRALSRRRLTDSLGLALIVCLLSRGSVCTQQASYVIGPQDVLAITVWDQEDLSGKFSVETDGTFAFPLIGRVKAGGITVRDLEADLKRRLADGFFKNPQITVAVEQYHSQRVFVVGEIRNPGPYPLTGEMSLIEALARAGSTLPTAATEAVIVRPAPGDTHTAAAAPDAAAAAAVRGDPRVVRVDINDLQSGVLTENMKLRDGDTIFIPRAATVFVSGQVKNSG